MQQKPFVIIIALLVIMISGKGVCGSKEMEFDFRLPIPEQSIHRQYLGLNSEDGFTLDQIHGQILIVQIFSMYCPVCQREAKNLNLFFSKIWNNLELRKQIKLIGIGAGNSDFEVGFFKDNYSIEFPLFSDNDFSIHKKIGQVRTPFFLVLKPGDSPLKPFFTHSGEIGSHEKFLDKIITESGIELKPSKRK